MHYIKFTGQRIQNRFDKNDPYSGCMWLIYVTKRRKDKQSLSLKHSHAYYPSWDYRTDSRGLYGNMSNQEFSKKIGKQTFDT